ncbi:50S ribosomal protein L11 [Desmospora activa]|uniref:Large ribosomal subunit protein uL11 n=1 Tax=Desmospora activa DSM 45169 TaxID=1121389 RepID=A0A2T4Z6Z0_9BACL|nr:50S ribosomal protein L11 [Desmospora activa]PTM57664.1 large subunit ribosomal protein L11 [Desmospora activa DSM 45169]
MKKVVKTLKIELQAGAANPATVGKDLGPTGINLLGFCQQYNEKTAKQKGLVIPAEVTIFEDRSFTIQTKTPPTAFLLKRAAGVDKGAARPGSEVVGSVTRKQVEEVARIKLPDLNTSDLEAAMRMIEGTARNMGIAVREGR